MAFVWTNSQLYPDAFRISAKHILFPPLPLPGLQLASSGNDLGGGGQARWDWCEETHCAWSHWLMTESLLLFVPGCSSSKRGCRKSENGAACPSIRIFLTRSDLRGCAARLYTESIIVIPCCDVKKTSVWSSETQRPPASPPSLGCKNGHPRVRLGKKVTYDEGHESKRNRAS